MATAKASLAASCLMTNLSRWALTSSGVMEKPRIRARRSSERPLRPRSSSSAGLTFEAPASRSKSALGPEKICRSGSLRPLATCTSEGSPPAWDSEEPPEELPPSSSTGVPSKNPGAWARRGGCQSHHVRKAAGKACNSKTPPPAPRCRTTPAITPGLRTSPSSTETSSCSTKRSGGSRRIAKAPSKFSLCDLQTPPPPLRKSACKSQRSPPASPGCWIQPIKTSPRTGCSLHQAAVEPLASSTVAMPSPWPSPPHGKDHQARRRMICKDLRR
mmetsp:Transcript_86142/g.238743  ORF Transcript_86142/g.238743 Transcript_86142/m.238743 type:complete len:273 (-) Transcript_86142:312-1130(-)